MAEDTLEEILGRAQLSADERKLFDNTLQKNPELKKGWLRQSDYSRQMNEVTARKKQYDDAVEYNLKMKAWADEKVPIWESLVKKGVVSEDGDNLWLTEKDRLAKELDEAKKAAVAGADMDPAELTKRVEEIVKANGGVTQAEYKALVASEAARIAEEKVNAKYAEFETKFNTSTIPFTAAIAANNGLAALDYERVTGKEWTDDTQKELYALMTKENNMNPRAVMRIMLEPVRKEKETADLIEKEVQKRLAEERRLRGVSGDEPYIPIPGVNQPKGSLQAMLDASVEPSGDAESAIMAAGRRAAAELRTEGKY